MEIEAVIEDPQGSTVRHHWSEAEQRWIGSRHRFSSHPWPANYGFIPGTLNDVDGEDLDILVISSVRLETGCRVIVRPVGLLLRPDGDDKVLGVPVDDPTFGHIWQFQHVPVEQIRAIEGWFAAWSEAGIWRDELAALRRIERARIPAH